MNRWNVSKHFKMWDNFYVSKYVYDIDIRILVSSTSVIVDC